MTSSRDAEEPLNTRPRLAVPREPVGEKPTRFANMSLGLDALFCNVVGLVFTLTGAFMSDWLGVAGWILTIFGVGVLLWSFVVTLFANRRVSRRREIDFVIKANSVAMALSIVVLVIPDTMTSDGKILLAAGLAVTLGFTIAQSLARRSLPPPSSQLAGTEDVDD